MSAGLARAVRRRSIVTSVRGVAALEFGILAPVMALILLAVFNLGRLAIMWEQVWSASQAIAESATTISIQKDGSAKITLPDINLVLSEVYAQIPWVADGIATAPAGIGPGSQTPVTAVLSSVNYTPAPGCTPTNCPYQQIVEWSQAYVPANGLPGFNPAAFRPCLASAAGSGGSIVPGSIVDAPDYTKDQIYVSDPFMIADVSVKFTPYLFNFITGSITLTATSYVPVRSNAPGAPPAQQYAMLSPPQTSLPNGCVYTPPSGPSG